MANHRSGSGTRSSGVAALVGALLLTAAGPGVAAAAEPVAFRLGDPRITESSGLARDEAGGIYWTVNDSGSTGVVFGVGPDGRLRGTLNFRAEPRDVEAVAVQGNMLYVADIGDNARSRDLVTVYFFQNPRANGLTVMYNSYDFRYPDGAQDAETLLVDGRGRLFVVTKGAEGGVYAAPERPNRAGVNLLRRVGDAPALVTDGVFLPGDQQIALLTYSSVVVLDAASYDEVATETIPAQSQAESLAVNLAGDGLLVGSEGRNSPVYAVPVPGGAGSASPGPSGSPASGSPDSSAGDPAEEEAGPGPSRRGTLLALGLAGFVALVAGIVVAAARRPD